MTSIKQLKEELYEADEVIYELRIQQNIDKKNIDNIKKICNNYEIKITSLNKLLENYDIDIYDKNLEIKDIEEKLKNVKNINNELQKNNKILIDTIDDYKNKICDLEDQLNIKDIALNKLNNDNKNYEKLYIELENYKYCSSNKEEDNFRNELSLYDELRQIRSEDTFFSIASEPLKDVCVQIDINNEIINELKQINKCSQIRIFFLRLFNFLYIILISYLLYELLS